ncbi:MAG: hypothetical protein K2W96_19040 [Gemmataceae bacterium]|nr:hypothetical protein [Gemmataceae bacterium]
MAVAAPPNRPGLSGAGQILGILTPILSVLALLMTFLLAVAVTSGPGGRGGGELQVVVSFGLLALFAFIMIFSAALLLRLGGAVQARRRPSIEY